MKASAVKYSVLSLVSSVTILIILLMPFHAFLTVWLSSLVGHYTALRLWKEALLVVCGVALLFLLLTDHKIREQTMSRRLVWLVAIYGAVNVIWGLVAWHNHNVTEKALGYSLIINLRFLVFFLVTWAVSLRMARLRSHWQWITLWPAAIVVLFGLLQLLVLPRDFLTHFGYGPHTIEPYETINHNAHYIRIASTLRGANPLGAYLLLPISMLSVLMLRKKAQRRQLILLAAMIVCLFFSFSRSAWLGAVISLGIIAFMSFHAPKIRSYLGVGLAALVLVAAGGFAILRHNDHFENIIFHTQEESKISSTSNHGHLTALKSGVSDIVHQPLGRGPGSAGPASVYNGDHLPRIAENYYLQVGQETGLIGLALLVLIMSGVGYLLWLRRDDPLALSLFASFIGLIVVNMLSHAWADDTLAYIWWGLAGIAMAPNLKEQREQQDANRE